MDKSKGVTYVYSDAGSILAINLNGNSVVIEPATNPDDEKKYAKIILMQIKTALWMSVRRR